MVFEAGLKKWKEQQQRERERLANEHSEYALRVKRANLAPLPATDYRGAEPITTRSWLLHRQLLQAEGLLNESAESSIRLGLEAVELRELRGQICREELRLHADVKAGTASGFFAWLDQEGIPREFTLRQVCMPLLTWESIKRLGLDGDPRFEPEARRAREAVNSALRERDLISSLPKAISGPEPQVEPPAEPEGQSAPLPENFVPVRISIPDAALKTDRIDWNTVRYHPEFGLVTGFVRHYSYFDRGAGAYPGARGARVHEYSADVALLMSLIKRGKTPSPLSRESVWIISPESEAVIGRWSENGVVRSSLSYRKIFRSEEGVKAFLHGTTPSAFWQSTLPVSVHFNRDEGVHELHFRARPLSSLQLKSQK